MCMEREEGTWGREGERISFLVRLLTNRHKHLILILGRMWVGYEAGYNVHVPNHTCDCSSNATPNWVSWNGSVWQSKEKTLRCHMRHEIIGTSYKESRSSWLEQGCTLTSWTERELFIQGEGTKSTCLPKRACGFITLLYVLLEGITLVGDKHPREQNVCQGVFLPTRCFHW